MERIMIIIPAYNEEESIAKLLPSLNFPPQDIIVVDDGSTDNTISKSQSFGVHVIRHEKNKGKGMAHRTGFNFASKEEARWVITMDADGQHSPKDIPKFIKAIKEKKGDMIIGEREVTIRTMPFLRFLTNLWTSFIVSILGGKRVKDAQSGFRAISKEIFTSISFSTNNFQTESEIIIKAARRGFRITSVPVRTIYNESYSYIKPFLDTLRFIKLAFQSL
ncbi:MAG: glycosyltransferase family 2 protein [bacterium (Candidatus Stahlbacteria) CG08_land_8_20_14_0_20_40_26]|nr:MAG: dolichyl-phosphate mannose synthase [bacterium (Candidatus Stahlbacteria) CG23_combo_of_CG06-09_8_20_14_all_40_9]PIS24278.1 MAG: glycosyltransferase family 2 protein [bacterium (Candidatus Stahlbacteria) CG08_land_8_20_14_0_20_40_26]